MMSKSIISEGKTTGEAIEKGLKELKVSKDKVDVKVLESERLGKVRCAILEEQGILFVEDDIIDIISKYVITVNSLHLSYFLNL